MTQDGLEAARPGALRRVAEHELAVPSGALAPGGFGEYGPYPEPRGSAMDLRVIFMEALRIFRKWKWMILGLGLGFAVLGGIQAVLKAPLYTSTLRLQIDRNTAKPVEDNTSGQSETQDADFLRTQLELLLTRSMAERVVSSLRLGDDAEFLKPREVSLQSLILEPFSAFRTPDLSDVEQATRDRWASAVVLENRAVKPVAGSRLFDISYSDTVPTRAARIATGLADAYIEANIDKRFQANSYAKSYLEDQLKQLKGRLEETENQMLTFAEKQQIVDVDDRASTAETSLNAANQSLATLVQDRVKAEELSKQVEAASGINLPQFLSNNVIDKLRQTRNDLTTDYQEKSQTFLPSYPVMVQIKNKIAEVERQINVEIRALRQSYRASYDAAKSQEDAMRTRVNGLREDLLDLQKRSVRYNILKREVETNRNLYNSLLQRYKEVDVASGVGANNVFIVDRATIPTTRSSPNITRWLLFSMLAGLGLGAAIAWLIERFDDTLKSADEMEAITGLPTLGLIPKIGPETTVEAELANPRSALSESYRSLATALQFSTANGLPASIVTTSAGPSEGKSHTALTIARHFAGIGLKVLLIDGDLRNPSLHKKMQLPNKVGLTNVLSGGGPPPKFLQPTDTERLVFMGTGPLPRNAAEILSNARLQSLLSVGANVFDLIIIDGPPVMGLADAPLLSSAVSATLFVCAAGQARRGQVRWAMQRLRMGRGHIAGCVVTKFDSRQARYGGYGYGYGYGYGNAYEYGAITDEQSDSPQLGKVAS